MATHSSILAWRIPRREEPGGLHPWGRKELDTTEQLGTHTRQGSSLLRSKSLKVLGVALSLNQ